MQKIKVSLMFSVLALSLLALPGCEKGAGERAGEKVDKAMDKTGDAIKKGVNNTKDAAKEGTNKLNDATK